MKKYKIYYSGILRYGYVTVRFFGKNGSKTSLPPTKFNFKIVAKIVCWLMQKNDDSFNTFTVYEYEVEHKAKNSFIEHCLLLKKREPFFIILGLATWFIIACFIALCITVIILINQYNQL